MTTSELPAHLAGDEAAGLKQGETIAQFEIGAIRNFVYLVIDWSQRKAAIVDPQQDLSAPLTALTAHSLALTQVLLTHTHHDHVAGLPALVQLFPSLPIICHDADVHRLRESGTDLAALRAVVGGERFTVGALDVEVLHTPGHSAGGACYLVGSTPPSLLTGDTVFIGDCGRTDLETGSSVEMFASLQRLKKLPGDCIVLPGHHYSIECASVLSREWQVSPPFLCASADELARLP